jgi:DUF4097 and DUF4098 domain-containing protein YvlB
MHRVILILTLAGAVLLADDWNKHFTVSANSQLRVETNDASVRVRAWDRNQIEARVTTTGYRIGPGYVTVTDRQSGDLVELDVRIPRQFGFNFGTHQVHIEVQVPRATQTNIHTGDGRIDTDGLKGEARLSTGDGRIEVDGHDGILDAHTGDGRIHVRGRLDRLNVRTGDGSVQLELLQGSKVSSEWRVQTGDGHVTIRIPDDLAANLDAHTGDGRITSNLRGASLDSQRRNELRGKLNGGGALFVVRTNDGGITLERM